MKNEVFVDTDVFEAFLVHTSPGKSLLRHIASFCICYTSVLNAAELLAAASHEYERSIVTDVLCGVRVLGFHQRYASTFGKIFRDCNTGDRNVSFRTSLIAGMCIESKLSLVTYHENKYKDIDRLHILPTEVLLNSNTGQDVQEYLHSI